ncbi:MAG: amidohydrolase family protein [Actinomycetota bacterium]|nr:amidohydrolase family protein [Actinomycetota bacterium]
MTRVLSADWVLPVDAPPIADGALAIEDGRIAAVATRGELGDGEHFDEAAIVPGFVNAHSHLEYAVYSGFGDGFAFAPWITLHNERKRALEWGDHVAIARLGAAECLAAGITTIGDASYSGGAALACADLGLRAIVYLEVFGSDVGAALARMADARGRIEPALSERVRAGVSPHTTFTVSPEVYAACAKLGLPQATHLAETEAEQRWLTSGEGPFAQFRAVLRPPARTTGVRLLAERGLLGPAVCAAHCVLVDDEEIALLAEHDVAVAHCPRSNALLGGGIAPLIALRAAGVRIGLGTDSPASTPSFDVFEELRAAIMLARVRERRADALPASQALELATLGSARALGLDGDVGSLTPGKRADLTVVSLAGSPYLPWEDPAAAVVFGGSPERVVLTAVDGEVRYKEGEFEWHELRRRAANARGRMLHAAPAAELTAGSP